MVIISTMAIEVSIQAVSPELGEQFSITGGLALASQDGVAAGAACSAAGAAAPCCACEGVKAERLRTTPRRIANISAASPARAGFLKVMVRLPWEGCYVQAQIAAASVSPVRMRTALSRSRTKILPSPIWPVLAAAAMVSMVLPT